MRKKATIRIFFLLAATALACFPGLAGAATLTVSKSCGTTVEDCFATISQAITKATTTANTIEIEPGTYVESITISKSGLTLRGIETARTVIQSSGVNPAISISSSNVTITRLTIKSTPVGIQAADVSGLTINNNIFWGSGSGTAIQLAGTQSVTKIDHNTFFQNQIAVSSSVVDVRILNNIFSSNNTALAATGSFTDVENNLFHNNTSIGAFTINPQGTNIPNSITTNDDPMFVRDDVAPPDMDLHLRTGSGAIGTDSDGSDIGAFGGSGADTIPFLVSGVSVTFLPPASVKVSWSKNEAYNIGGYNVYYRLGSEPRTKVSLASTVTSTVISGLTGTVNSPGTPVLNPVEYADQKLILSWWPVTNATGYKVHVFDSGSSTENTIDVGNTVFYILNGLVNGREYGITISAYSQAVYRFSVTAVDNIGTGTPGVEHESAFSAEKSVSIGDAVEGLRSSPTQTQYPDRIIGAPDLPDKGCFIATAAYGYYSAPQVQVLRTFRDRYLVTNRPGRAFVDWYYRYGPKGAEFMNAHPWVKPIARAALLPLVGAAWFMTEVPFGAGIAVLFMIVTVMVISYGMVRRKSPGCGRQP